MSLPPAAAPAATFVFATCQVGAEAVLKAEVTRRWPGFRFAYSRPGFVTFKLPAGNLPAESFDLGAVFARAAAVSLGKAVDADPAHRAAKVWELVAGRPFDALHVWQRDAAPAGDHGYEPDLTDAASEAAAAIVASRGPVGSAAAMPVNAPARRGDLVLDCVLVEPDEWWVGSHRAASAATTMPGGFFAVDVPAGAVSRAYGKMAEAIAWSGLRLKRGDQAVEIGCSPGGASQALLDRGLIVTGIDPADVDERVLAHPRFRHVRKRGADVRRRELRGMRWLAADMNVAPTYTLTTVEQIVTHPTVHVEGLLLTLKLADWSLAVEVPGYVDRVRSWGFGHAAARQLAHNRQEICIVARR